ncbi:hypothetical protein OC842_003182 [Tilletia horrida]|uniref:Extracellular membrane protein CFEM domain-containing protein n=1 Tax=Tilletia horrida TaxID=155126 RepID=A0AAN6JKZ8_9BASI|nr:hypothetical protein OC842_003182 [Tilletia horrida]
MKPFHFAVIVAIAAPQVRAACPSAYDVAKGQHKIDPIPAAVLERDSGRSERSDGMSAFQQATCEMLWCAQAPDSPGCHALCACHSRCDAVLRSRTCSKAWWTDCYDWCAKLYFPPYPQDI